MGLVRFMTVYDDEEERVLNLNQRMMFDISSPPAFYRSEGKSYLDNFNANSRKFSNMCNSGAAYTVPTIPSSVFQYSLEKLRDTGYLAVFIVCPHGKWLPYYKEAVHAAKNVNRTAKRNSDIFMKTFVVNSKAFGIGSVLFTNALAVDFYHNRNNTQSLVAAASDYAKSSTTYILTKNDTVFGQTHDFQAYRITDTRVFPVNIGNSVDEIKFDRFADIVGKAIVRSDGRYAVSYGYNCGFVGNILGRIERDYKHNPLVLAQYSIVSAQLFGTQTICIHLGDYI